VRILVTGLSGFTGHYLKLALEARGHTVFGLSCDLTDIAALEIEVKHIQPDGIIHLAGISSVDHKNANAFYDVNIVGTRNLLVALDKHVKNLSAVLLISSANIYGNHTANILDENIIPQPRSDYAISKLAMEQMALLWLDRLPIFIARPFNYTGVGQSSNFLIPKIVNHFKQKSEQIELGNLDVYREFGDVRDVANVYVRLIETPPIGKTLNICTSQPYALKQVISYCQELTGHTIKVRVNPAFVRKNEIKTLQGSCDRLKKIVKNWHPRPLIETLAWMLEER
jgi:nucleoside-diphosphate-sugar epimerase